MEGVNSINPLDNFIEVVPATSVRIAKAKLNQANALVIKYSFLHEQDPCMIIPLF